MQPVVRQADALLASLVVPKLHVEGTAVGKYGTKKEALKRLTKWGVDTSTVAAVKKVNGMAWMTITFTSEDALEASRPLFAAVGSLRVERKLAAPPQQPQDVQRAPSERDGVLADVRDVVTPLWRVPYSEQLETKQKELRSCLDKAVRAVRRENKAAKDGQNSSEWPLRKVDDIVPAVDGGVRNKMTFTVGRDASGAPCIGFRVGRTEHGSTAVAAPTADLGNMSAACMRCWQAGTEVLRSEPVLPPRDALAHVGFWRALEVRSNERGEWVALWQVDDTYEGVDMAAVHATVLATMGSVEGCVGLGVAPNRTVHNQLDDVGAAVWLKGDGVLLEQLGELSFRIPQGAFFQTCTAGCVRLYDEVVALAAAEAQRLGAQSVDLLDVCCGIGTIGLYVRKRLGPLVSTVTGIDIVPEAIEAARLNAVTCGYPEGMTFVAGPAEDHLENALKADRTRQLICIVDPPRGGLHPRVLRALRACAAVKSLIYVSCNPRSLVNDLVPLTKAPTKRFNEPPFVPVSMRGFDMFKGAEHVECIMLLQRH